MYMGRLSIISGIVLLLSVAGISAENDGKSPNVSPISDNRMLSIGKPVMNADSVPVYGKLEISFDLQGTFDNAFDSNQIDVHASITAPNGKVLEQPAFLYQDYERSLNENTESFTKKGDAIWKVRFAPVEVGRYSVTIKAKDRAGAEASAGPLDFECVKSNSKGFIRISSKDKRYFAFDDGSVYFPTGANICWSGSKGTYDYDTWLPKYKDAGCNYFRIFLGPGWATFALETYGEGCGAGKINLMNAWRIDYLLQLAEQYGQYVMFSIDSFNTLRKRVEEVDLSYPYWEGSPINKLNGGPISEPIEFWTDKEAVHQYRCKLRYLAARYGWSTNVMSWEFWNEVDIISPEAYNKELMVSWHVQMSDYLRTIDCWKHLQSTSFAQWPGISEIMELKQIDFTQTHDYYTRDMSLVYNNRQIEREKFGKPHYIAEFGADAGGADPFVDPDGIAFHTGLWSSSICGCSGTAASWWWDNHIDPNDLYKHLAALNSFLKGTVFDEENFVRIENASMRYINELADSTYGDLQINGPISWNPSVANRPTSMSISSDGKVSYAGIVSGILHGTENHQDKHNPLTINIDLPHPSSLKVFVSGVSGYGGAHLVISMDGKTHIDKDMPDSDGDANFDTIHQFDGMYELKIPAGRHSITVENIGRDWVYVRYIIEKAVRHTSPALRAYGMKGAKTSMIWIENAGYTWYAEKVLKHPAETQRNVLLAIPGWANGNYTVEIWNTYTGKRTSIHRIKVTDGVFEMKLPPIDKDIAMKILKNS